MVKQREDVTFTEEWEFSAEVYGIKYRAVWVHYSYQKWGTEARFLVVERDREEYHCNQIGKEDPLVMAFTASAIAFRVEEIKRSYKGLDTNDRWIEPEKFHERAKEVLVTLAELSWDGEYMGQEKNETFYLQHAAPLMGFDMSEMWPLARELMEEKRIGLNGAILIPYDDYAATKASQESSTGHKDYDATDMGGWWCNYCGARRWPEEQVNPKDVPCIEDAYVDAS